MLSTLDIRGFRGFDEFAVRGLSRVTLLLGSNNAGKTAVMEAAEILLTRGAPWALMRSPLRRGDGQLTTPVVSARAGVSVKYLFHGFQLRAGTSFEISGDNQVPWNVRCELRPSSEPDANARQEQLPLSDVTELVASAEDQLALDLVVTRAGERAFAVALRPGGVLADRFPRDRDDEGPPVNFVDTKDPESRLTMLWDRVVLTPKEADVVQAIQLVDPSIERIALLSSLGPSRPQMMVKRTGADEPLPLGTMGDGAKRLVVLSVNLVNAANGFLLVDEIDTGLHYSVLAPMWRLVLATARRMNVQVFASTHSLDCVRALAWALERDPEYAEDTSVHRVVRGRHETVRYSAGELRLAVEEDMEIR